MHLFFRISIFLEQYNKKKEKENKKKKETKKEKNF
jgi:preprotein translocase subunit SecG